jgi:ribonuclease P protein component
VSEAPHSAVKGPRKGRFETIFRDGKRVSGDLCRLYAYPGQGKIGVSTAKKIGSHARRNRVKRRFREAIRTQPDMLDRRLDYVVVVNAGSADAPFEPVKSELRALFGKINDRWAGDLECS